MDDLPVTIKTQIINLAVEGAKLVIKSECPDSYTARILFEDIIERLAAQRDVTLTIVIRGNSKLTFGA